MTLLIRAVPDRFVLLAFVGLSILLAGPETRSVWGQFHATSDDAIARLPVPLAAQSPFSQDEGGGDNDAESPVLRPLPVVEGDTAASTQQELIKSLQQRIDALEEVQKEAADAAKKKKAEDALKPTIKPRGRLHTDANWFHQGAASRAAVGDVQDGTFFRRARLGFDAKALDFTEWRLDFEMASGGGRPSIFDAYGRVNSLPWLGNVQVGHFREPFSLEAQTSSNWYTFIERGLNNAFDPSRNWGVMAFNHNEAETVTWATGVFREGSDNFGDDIGDSGERAITSRITWLPFYHEPSQGRSFLEFGVSHSYRDPDNRFMPGGDEQAIVQYQGRPENNLNEDLVGRVPPLVAMNVPDAVDLHLYGVESTWNLGSVNLQAEYIASAIDRDAAPSAYFHGTYVQASYFLTGESRKWDRALGTFGRAEVFEPFFLVRTCDQGIGSGIGAWEIAARWNYLDLNDPNAGLTGGYLDATTFALNWYLHSYMRVMFNYTLADLHDPTVGRSDMQVFNERMDVHF
jgi:phosphate-selective porin OprO/OprP